jgi:hypothetical protein
VIRQCLNHAATVDVRDILKNLRIHTNELEGLKGPGGASGKITQKADAARREIGGRAILYIGDSPTDLEALTTADIGIIIRDDLVKSGPKELASICERLQIAVSSIDKFVRELGEQRSLVGSRFLARLAEWVVACKVESSYCC